MTDNHPAAVTFAPAGMALTPDEKALFREADPFGFIIFGRNIDNPDQVKALVDAMRAAVGREAPVMIDQEGGRVQRMKAPHWPAYPSALACADVPGTARALAGDLVRAGIDVNCAPVLDILFPDTHKAIGDRAYGDTAETVFSKGREVCKAFLEQGVTPVIKHIPGQGRATLDSHYDLPVVDAALADLRAADFVPFRKMADEPFIDRVWGMISHIVYPAVDPDHPASASAKVIDLIRKELHFDGLLLSDDVSMEALATYGQVEDRCKAMLDAGCDIALYCAGKLDEMERIAAVAPPMREDSAVRYERSHIRRRPAA